jgi:hypothetical protein
MEPIARPDAAVAARCEDPPRGGTGRVARHDDGHWRERIIDLGVPHQVQLHLADLLDAQIEAARHRFLGAELLVASGWLITAVVLHQVAGQFQRRTGRGSHFQ